MQQWLQLQLIRQHLRQLPLQRLVMTDVITQVPLFADECSSRALVWDVFLPHIGGLTLS